MLALSKAQGTLVQTEGQSALEENVSNGNG